MLILQEMITGNQRKIKCQICEHSKIDRNIDFSHMWHRLLYTVPYEDKCKKKQKKNRPTKKT